jgi:hypothetical protein
MQGDVTGNFVSSTVHEKAQLNRVCNIFNLVVQSVFSGFFFPQFHSKFEKKERRSYKENTKNTRKTHPTDRPTKQPYK